MNDKIFKRALHQNHQDHELEYFEYGQTGVLFCHHCKEEIARWPLASLEPYYELHQSIDALRKIFDEHFGPEGWDYVSFDFDRIDNRLDDVRVYLNHTEVYEEHSDLPYLIEHLDEQQDYLLLLESSFSPYLIKDKYPDEYIQD